LFSFALLGDEIERILKEIHSPWCEKPDDLPFRLVRDQAANGKKGVLQFFAGNPPRADYDGNDCVCHIMDREFKKALHSSPLGAIIEQQHKIVAYFKKSNKAANFLKEEQQSLLSANANYFSERLEALGWNAEGSWVQLTASKKPLKLIISMIVRWWSDIDQNTRFILLEEPLASAISKLRKELKKKGGEKKQAKREMLKILDRDMDALRKAVPILYPIKLAIKELEGNYSFSIGLFGLIFVSGEKYPTYPRIVKWLAVLDAHFKEAKRVEEDTPGFNARVVSVCQALIAVVATCYEKLNDDAFIAALFHIGIRDTFFTRAQSSKYWEILEDLYRFSLNILYLVIVTT
jgi:hypothetical protein